MESSESPSLLSHQAPPIPPQKSPFFNFLRCFFPLSLISFGGPQAHIALFHTTFVDPPDPTPDVPILPEQTFLELYALAQSLPGPGSTQVAASLGATFGGSIGALLTFLVWHLPGFALMTAAGLWFHAHLHTDSAPLIAAITDHAIGLIAAAFAFVLLAAFKIISKTCNTKLKMSITLVSLFLAVTAPPAATSWLFVVLLALGGISHYLIVQYYTVSESENPESEVVDEEKLAASDDFSDDSNHIPDWNCHISTTTGTLLLFTCFAFSIFTALLSSKDSGAHLLKTFWRIGLTVFGGGIVVVPMLLK